MGFWGVAGLLGFGDQDRLGALGFWGARDFMLGAIGCLGFRVWGLRRVNWMIRRALEPRTMTQPKPCFDVWGLGSRV